MEANRGVVPVVAGAVFAVGAIWVGVAMWSGGDDPASDQASTAGVETGNVTGETVVDRGPVPDLAGMTVAEAESELVGAGFVIEVYGDRDSTVTEQFPEPGEVLLYSRNVVVRFGEILPAPDLAASAPTTTVVEGNGFVEVIDPETGEVTRVPVDNTNSSGDGGGDDGGEGSTSTTVREGVATTVPRGGTGPPPTVVVEVTETEGDGEEFDTEYDPGVTVDQLVFHVGWDDAPLYELGVYSWLVTYSPTGVEADEVVIGRFAVSGADANGCETVTVPLDEPLSAAGFATLEAQIGEQPDGVEIAGRVSDGAPAGRLSTRPESARLLFTQAGSVPECG